MSRAEDADAVSLKVALGVSLGLALGLAAPTAAPPVARAQTGGAAIAQARAHFDRAEQLFHQRDSYALALDAYRRAYALMEGHPRRALLHFNIARCLDELGRADEARAAYARFLEEAPAADPGFREDARTRIAEMDRRLAAREGAGAMAEEPSGWNWAVAGGLLALAAAPIALASYAVATEGGASRIPR